jgi:hypothetical protein
MLRKYPKIVALLLLLVFTQKAGLRLWMHHWFHESKIAQHQPATGSDNLQLKCDCFDDAMMPLLESTPFIVPIPIRQYATLRVAGHSPIRSADKVYYSLKGPPAPATRA